MKRVFLSCLTALLLLSLCLSLAACGVRRTSDLTAEETPAASGTAEAPGAGGTAAAEIVAARSDAALRLAERVESISADSAEELVAALEEARGGAAAKFSSISIDALPGGRFRAAAAVRTFFLP